MSFSGFVAGYLSSERPTIEGLAARAGLAA